MGRVHVQRERTRGRERAREREREGFALTRCAICKHPDHTVHVVGTRCSFGLVGDYRPGSGAIVIVEHTSAQHQHGWCVFLFLTAICHQYSRAACVHFTTTGLFSTVSSAWIIVNHALSPDCCALGLQCIVGMIRVLMTVRTIRRTLWRERRVYSCCIVGVGAWMDVVRADAKMCQHNPLKVIEMSWNAETV